jgi:hypothetical protein
VLTLLINNGFMASDEYWTGITRYIPAQKASLTNLLKEDDVKSPTQLLPFYAVSQSALKMGVEHPYEQYKITRITLGFINILLILLAFYLYNSTAVYSGAQGSISENKFHYLLLAFFFPAAFVLTRPMFESMAAPWLTLGLVFSYRYDQKENKSDLFWGVLTASMAFCLRPQVGLCALIFVILPILKKRWKDLFYVMGLGLVCFILAGLPDLFLRGQFHQSLLAVTVYNFKEGHNYGQGPWYFYLMILPVLYLLPVWGWFVKSSDWVTNLKSQRSLWISSVLFIFLHSLFSQKFERFMIPVIPLFMLVFSGLVFQLIQKKELSLKAVFALGFCLVFNFVLFFPASFGPSQINIINLALFIDKNPQFSEIYNINESITWIPDVFIDSKNRPLGFNEKPKADLEGLSAQSCEVLVIVNEKNKLKFANDIDKYKLIQILDVNLIERVAFKLNPIHNERRSPLYLYSCLGASSAVGI